MKRCSKCKQDKELICFGKDKSNSDGFLYYCKECNREKAAKWRRENPEKAAKWWRENPEKVREKAAKWRRENPEKAAKWRRENPEKAAKWRRENPEKVRENAAKQKQEKAALLFFQMANFASELTKNKETI